jgi:hypothetical protein
MTGMTILKFWGCSKMFRCKARKKEELHPACAGYTPQVLARRMPGAFCKSLSAFTGKEYYYLLLRLPYGNALPVNSPALR